jgi:UMF1 family MFS transporter
MTRKRVRLSWALFDWAQQPYFTLVGSFIFRPYFVAAVAVTPAIGQAQIGITGAVAGLIVAIAGPVLGILLERGSLKAWLAWTSLPFVLACIGLWWAFPNGGASIPFILVCLVVAAAFAELTTTVNNAMLPPIAAPGALGRLSGYGVALGCLGGIAAAALVLVLFLQPDQPLFGLDKAAHEPERFIGPFSAIWYVLFLLPLFLFYPKDTRSPQRAQPLRELLQSVRTLPRNRPMLWFLVGRMLAADAIGAIQIFGGIIAATTFGWGPAELGLFGIFILGAGGIGSLLGGRIDDRISAKTSVQLTCAVLAIALAGIGSVSPDHVLFFIPVTPAPADAGFLASTAEQVFFGFTALLGLASGPLVGSMRTWMAQLSPPAEAGRWFGLYGVAGRATAFAAPLMVALGTLLTGDVGAAVPVILAFLLAGMLAFWFVPATATQR